LGLSALAQTTHIVAFFPVTDKARRLEEEEGFSAPQGREIAKKQTGKGSFENRKGFPWKKRKKMAGKIRIFLFFFKNPLQFAKVCDIISPLLKTARWSRG